MDINDAQLFEKYYYMFTNSGHYPAEDSITGVSDESMPINDLLVLPDMTRLI